VVGYDSGFRGGFVACVKRGVGVGALFTVPGRGGGWRLFFFGLVGVSGSFRWVEVCSGCGVVPLCVF